MKRPEKILANDLVELEVLDLGEGTIIGSIVDFEMNREGKVSLIGILGEQWYKGGHGIEPNAITNVNNERVTIASASDLTEFCPDGEELFAANTDSFIQNKTVMLDTGEMLGRLQDFCFSMEDGQVTDLIVLNDKQKRVKVPVESFKTIGRDYIVIVPGAQSFDVQEESAATTEPVAEAMPDTPPPGGSIPAEVGAKTETTPVPEPEPSREDEKKALFGDDVKQAPLSKFDQKKRDFLSGKVVHRDLTDADGNKFASKGDSFDDALLEQLITAGMLGDIFIELTLKK